MLESTSPSPSLQEGVSKLRFHSKSSLRALARQSVTIHARGTVTDCRANARNDGNATLETPSTKEGNLPYHLWHTKHFIFGIVLRCI